MLYSHHELLARVTRAGAGVHAEATATEPENTSNPEPANHATRNGPSSPDGANTQEATAQQTKKKKPKKQGKNTKTLGKPLRVDKNWGEYRWLFTPERAAKWVAGQTFTVPEAEGYKNGLTVDRETFRGQPQMRDAAHSPVRVSDVHRVLSAARRSGNKNLQARRAAATLIDRGIVHVAAGLHAMNRDYKQPGGAPSPCGPRRVPPPQPPLHPGCTTHLCCGLR